VPTARLLAGLAVAALVAAACSGDDDDAGSIPSAVVVASAPVGPGTATTMPTSSTAVAAATVAPTTAAPPVGLDELAAGLLSSAEVGLPGSWTIRDLDPAIIDAEMATLADPVQGLATCPDGALRPAGGWVQRTFSGAEPLDTGMLRVDLILAVEDAGAFAARRDALAACTAGEESFLESSAGSVAPLAGSPLAPVGPEVATTTLTLSAGPTADVPYPSTYAIVAANGGGRTVTAVVGGLDLGVPFADTTRELVGRVLARL
jgi:hypothetical protein